MVDFIYWFLLERWRRETEDRRRWWYTPLLRGHLPVDVAHLVQGNTGFEKASRPSLWYVIRPVLFHLWLHTISMPIYSLLTLCLLLRSLCLSLLQSLSGWLPDETSHRRFPVSIIWLQFNHRIDVVMFHWYRSRWIDARMRRYRFGAEGVRRVWIPHPRVTTCRCFGNRTGNAGWNFGSPRRRYHHQHQRCQRPWLFTLRRRPHRSRRYNFNKWINTDLRYIWQRWAIPRVFFFIQRKLDYWLEWLIWKEQTNWNWKWRERATYWPWTRRHRKTTSTTAILLYWSVTCGRGANRRAVAPAVPVPMIPPPEASGTAAGSVSERIITVSTTTKTKTLVTSISFSFIIVHFNWVASIYAPNDSIYSKVGIFTRIKAWCFIQIVPCQ